MNNKTQNPNADIIINDKPPFIAIYGVYMVLLLMFVYYCIGNTISIPIRDRYEATIELECSDTNTLICHINFEDNTIFTNKTLLSLDIVDKNDKLCRIDNVEYTIHNRDNIYTIVVHFNKKSDINKINKIYGNQTHSCYVILNVNGESLSEHIINSIFLLFNTTEHYTNRNK